MQKVLEMDDGDDFTTMSLTTLNLKMGKMMFYVMYILLQQK